MYRRPEILTLDGILLRNGEVGETIAVHFALYCIATYPPSTLDQIWSGAWSASLREGPLLPGTLNDGKRTLARGSRLHIAKKRIPPSQQLYHDYRQKLSDHIFGTRGKRKPVHKLEFHNMMRYCIFCVEDVGQKRPAELCPDKEHPTREEDIFIFTKIFITDPRFPKLLCVNAPTKQNRQRLSNRREKLHFSGQFEFSEITVSLAHVHWLIVEKAKEIRVDLGRPYQVPSPQEHNHGNITQAKMRWWFKHMGDKLGFSTQEIGMFLPSLFRKCSMSRVTAAAKGNLILATQCVRHRSIETTNNHYQSYDTEKLAEFRQGASAWVPEVPFTIPTPAPRRSARIAKGRSSSRKARCKPEKGAKSRKKCKPRKRKKRKRVLPPSITRHA